MANVQALQIQNMYNTKIIFLWLIPVLFLLNSCSWFTNDVQPAPVKKIETVTKYIEKTPLNLPSPTPAVLSNINWVLVTPENADEVFTQLKKDNADQVIFGLTDDNYELLSKNFAQIRAYIIKQNEIINQYKSYYDNVTK